MTCIFLFYILHQCSKRETGWPGGGLNSGEIAFLQIQSLMNLQSQHTEQQSQNSNLLTMLIVILITYALVKIRAARRRKTQLTRPTMNIPRQKIIIALEIKDFLVSYTSKYTTGYIPLDMLNDDNLVVKLINKVFGIGKFYKPMFPVQKIKEFVIGMKNIKNVQLFIYTSLPPAIVNVLLGRLQLYSLFPETHRKYCELQNNDDQKHAIQVDQDTHRVIIMTPTYEDHFYEDDKYFLVLRPKIQEINFLKNTLKTLKNFIEQTQDLNLLHDRLGQLKVNLESDWSDYDL